MTEPTRQSADRPRLLSLVLSGWRRALIGLWGLCAFAMTAGLASAHGYSLPHPTRVNPQLVRALSERTRARATERRFTVTHVLYAECRCSRGILKHLIERRARRDVSESCLLVSATDDLIRSLSAAGYAVEVLEPAELKQRYAIEAAPLLIVADPSHEVRYLGGYTASKQAPDIRDLAIIDSVLAGAAAPEFPLFGCAVSRALQKVLDPFGVQYVQEQR